MAYFTFDLASITTAATTLGTGDGALVYYATMFGESSARYWIRGPRGMPAIGYILTTTPTMGVASGVFYQDFTTSPGLGNFQLGTALKCEAFARGTRWFAVQGPVTDMDQTSAPKRLHLYYTSVNEGVPPTT
jgi:hypothetical protein